jgi:hypothetical protein
MTRTSKAPSSQHAAQHEEEESSDAIQKVMPLLKPNYLYTFRRVDHRHPWRPTDFMRKQNHSMIQRNEDHMFGPLTSMITAFGNIFKLIGISR